MEQQVVRTSAHYANNKDIPTRHKGTSFEVEKNRVKNCTDHFSCKLFFHCPYFFPAYLCTLQQRCVGVQNCTCHDVKVA